MLIKDAKRGHPHTSQTFEFIYQGLSCFRIVNNFLYDLLDFPLHGFVLDFFDFPSELVGIYNVYIIPRCSRDR